MTQSNLARTGHTVVGVFNDTSQAEQAINDLKIAGFTPDSISVVTKDRSAQRELHEATGSETAQGALVGTLGGGTLGAVLGWLLAGGTALIPGIGPVAAAGIFGATVSGALIGGAVGGISGALVGQGVPETEAGEYEEHVRGGRTLVTVNAPTGQMLGAAGDVFERNGAESTRYYELGQTGPGRTFGAKTEPAPTNLTDSATMAGAGETGITENRPDYSTSDTEATRPGEPVSYNRERDINYGEGLRQEDISTLPERGQGTSTRGGAFNDRPEGEGLPDYNPDTGTRIQPGEGSDNNFPPQRTI